MAIAPDPRNVTSAAPTLTGGKKTAAPNISYVVSAPARTAAPSSTGTGTALGPIAAARAAQDTNAVIAGYRALQDYANQQGMLRAAQQGQLGLAASKYLEGLHLPERTTADYSAAAAAQRAAASGYSGGLQQTVGDAAAAVQANLTATGSPQTADNQSQAAGNALYALGGALPATQFGVTGPTVAAGLRGLPAQALGYGQQLALGQLGAGQQEAAKFNADIVGALAKQPILARDYLDTLLAAQAKAQADANTAAYQQGTLNLRAQSLQEAADYHSGRLKIDTFKANALVQHQDTQDKINAAKAQSQIDYNAARITNDASRIKETAAHNAALEKLAALNAANLQAYRSNQIDLGTFNANTSRINAQTSRINALKPPTASDAAQTAPPRFDGPNSSRLGIRTDQYGDPLLYGKGKNKHVVLMPGWKRGKDGMPVKKGSPGSSGSLTNQQRTSLQQAKQGAQIAAFGGTTKTKTPDTVRVASEDPGDGKAWSEPLTLPDESIYGYVNHLPAIPLAEALREAQMSGNPYAVAQIRAAYRRAAAARKTDVGGDFGPNAPKGDVGGGGNFGP